MALTESNNQSKQAGKAGAIGFLAQKMIGGLAKKKKLAGTSPPGLAQRTIGQQTTGQSDITRLRAKQGKSPGALADRRI